LTVVLILVAVAIGIAIGNALRRHFEMDAPDDSAD